MTRPRRNAKPNRKPVACSRCNDVGFVVTISDKGEPKTETCECAPPRPEPAHLPEKAL